MELNLERFIELFDSCFHSNYAEAGRQLNVAPAQLYRLINNLGKAGAVFFGRLRTYCDEHKLKFDDFIIYHK